MNKHVGCLSLGAGTLILLSQPVIAQDESRLELSGDLRIRFEQDWASRTASGTPRDDRARARVRGRLNAKFDLSAGLVARFRARTGGEGSQQNANITFADFDDNRTDELKALVDQYSFAWKTAAGGLEVGRMAFPFFTSNEYFWDADIAPLGAAGHVNIPLAAATKLRLNAGGFKLPVGLREYSGDLFAGQAVFESGPATLAAGMFGFNADVRDSHRLALLDGNGERDYTILAINAQYKLAAASQPLVLGADVYRNLDEYSSSLTDEDERTGYVVAATWGGAVVPGNVQLGYRYFHMEKLAVNASFAHDDIARFGTAAQASLTDLKGHDVHAQYVVTKSLTVGVRAMFVERLNSIENGKRARIDFVYKL